MAPLGTLYTTLDQVHPRVRKILAAAKLGCIELQTPSTFQLGVHNKTLTYLSKFPLGKIPTLETTSGLHLGESAAIAEYVARKGSATKQLLGSDDEEAALIRQWMCFGDGHLLDTATDLMGWRVGFNEFNTKTEEKGVLDLKRWLDYLEGQLKGRAWLVGEADRGPSLGDLVVAGTLCVLFMGYIDREMREGYPEMMRWYNHVTGVEGLKKIFEVEMCEMKMAAPS